MQKRRFSAAAFTNSGNKRAAVNIQRDVIKGVYLCLAGYINFVRFFAVRNILSSLFFYNTMAYALFLYRVRQKNGNTSEMDV